MPDKLLLLDKDGTLTIPADGNFPKEAWDQYPILGVKSTLGKYRSKGWTPIIISNQAGVAAGYKSLEECKAEMRYALHLFPEIKEAFFCPDFEGAECWRIWGKGEDYEICYSSASDDVHHLGIQSAFRKPKPGMLLLAQHLHYCDEFLYVGDRLEDQEAAKAADINFIWADDWVRS